MTARHKLKNMIIGVGLLVVAPAVLANDAQIEAGEQLYEEFCESCHGANKSGLSEYSGDLAGLTDRLEGVTEEMPDFGGVFEVDEIAGLQAYLSAPVSTEK